MGSAYNYRCVFLFVNEPIVCMVVSLELYSLFGTICIYPEAQVAELL